MITWDLNLWFKETVVDDEVVVDDVITINPAIYVTDDNDTIYGGVRKVYTGILYKCTPEETAKIRAFRSEPEYGSDWWDFRDDLYQLEISKGIQEFLNDLPDPYSIDIDDVDDLYYIDSISKLHNLVG
jgi:hypothetical protein